MKIHHVRFQHFYKINSSLKNLAKYYYSEKGQMFESNETYKSDS